MMSGDVFSALNSASANFFHQESEVLNPNPNYTSNPIVAKKGRSLPGTPDPDAEVIALSPKALMATNRFICEICNKGFKREQNLQLHRRGHNLPWKLKQRANKDQIKKKVYVCPEKTCVHHDPARALGDLTGIKKHFSRKHGEKKWKCEKCCKKYAVQCDLKAHAKTCGTREYKCGCGTIFSRRDSFITHRAFCDTLAEENSRITNANLMNIQPNIWLDSNPNPFMPSSSTNLPEMMPKTSNDIFGLNSSMENCKNMKEEPAIISKGNSNTMVVDSINSLYYDQNHINHSNYLSSSGSMSATALLHKASQMGSSTTKSNPQFLHSGHLHGSVGSSMTRDFIGLGGDGGGFGPLLPQEVARFAFMTSDMGLSHLASNNQ